MMCKGEGVEWSHAGVKYEFHVPISYVKGIYGVENKLSNNIIFIMTPYLPFITAINNSTVRSLERFSIPTILWHCLKNIVLYPPILV